MVTGRMRRLPITLRPVQHETIDSYLRRLAAANQLPDGLLRLLVGAQRRHRDLALLDRLAATTGQPKGSLLRALPELQFTMVNWAGHFPVRWNHYGLAVRACSGCMAARGITTAVIAYIPAEQRVCLRHGRWLAEDQLDIAGLPEIIAAHRRLGRLRRRFSRPATMPALGEALHVVNRWLHRRDPQDLHDRWGKRLAVLAPTSITFGYGEPTLDAATYPETVTLTGLFASPYWRGVALTGDPADYERFYAEAARRLGIPDFRPVNSFDPLAQWVRQEAESVWLSRRLGRSFNRTDALLVSATA